MVMSEARVWLIGVSVATLALILLWAGVFWGAAVLSLMAGVIWWWGKLGGSPWPSLMMFGAAVVSFAKSIKLTGLEAVGFGLGIVSLFLTVGNWRQQAHKPKP
jgi:hypothetical protein